MKICPNCRTEYTDDALQYCLQDGTPLIDSPHRTSDFNTESETVVAPKRVDPIRFDPPSSFQNYRTGEQPTEPYIIERAEKKSNPAMIAALSVLGTLLVVGLIGAGIWFYSNNRKETAVVNKNSASPNRAINTNNANNANNQNANLALPTPTASPTATPTAKPTIDPKQAKQINDDVRDVIGDWKNASENLDITGNIANYTDTVDYYTAGKVNISKIRADREKAFSDYDSIEINIDNLRVIPDPTGERATAIFDKGWKFEGADKRSAGKVQQQLTLDKINGRWLISGEKDLKLYYKE